MRKPVGKRVRVEAARGQVVGCGGGQRRDQLRRDTVLARAWGASGARVLTHEGLHAGRPRDVTGAPTASGGRQPRRDFRTGPRYDRHAPVRGRRRFVYHVVTGRSANRAALILHKGARVVVGMASRLGATSCRVRHSAGCRVFEGNLGLPVVQRGPDAHIAGGGRVDCCGLRVHPVRRLQGGHRTHRSASRRRPDRLVPEPSTATPLPSRPRRDTRGHPPVRRAARGNQHVLIA
jgi:hypothetical protein